jgi:hypothetical protein
MNENGNGKDVTSFVLGIVVVAIIYLLVQRELNKVLGPSHGGSGGGKGGGSSKSGGGCGCGCGGGNGTTPTNPGTSPGANSLDGVLAFPNSVQSNGGMSHSTFQMAQ